MHRRDQHRASGCDIAASARIYCWRPPRIGHPLAPVAVKPSPG